MTSTKQAREDRERLAAEGAPQRVLDAADEAIRHADAGRPVPAHLAGVLLTYIGRRSQQDRYGK